MRRALLFISFLTMVLAMWAGDVSPEQALKQAQDFVQRQVTAGRRAPGATPQLALKGTVSGLYVFNVADDEGFVIVSNDDRTTPVLGYSTSGSIDPNNMPANMRAWLQGYADEIAWMNEHNIQPASQSSSRRTNRSVKTAITPLVQTQWNQATPYNNQVKDYFPLGNAVTGCVATAMAQVMYYTARKAGLETSSTLADILGYTKKWSGYADINIPKIDAGTPLLWNKMLTDYSGSYTSDEADAVATLMRCCGVSVNMIYRNSNNGGSSASSSDIPPALINYFGYDASVQLVNRDNYSYADWIEILYYELSNGRPILYGGQSTGGGHEFVCDGYQGEDYFHINWGWGGSSDDYFKLSVLNPYEHGIGGSTNKTGFNFAQDAVIGIQLNGAGGSVSGLVSGAKEIDLSVSSFNSSSFTPESGVAKAGEEITCTINVTNNSSDDFDGDIIVYEETKGKWLNGKNVQLAAGKNKDIQIPFTIDKAGTYKMLIINSLGYTISSEVPIEFVVVNGASSSNDVELTVTKKSVDNTELISGSTDEYKLYGNKFRATINMKNDTGTNYEGKLLWKLLPGSYSGTFTFESQSVTVPKNSNIDVIIEMDNIDMSTYYQLCYCHKKGDSHTTIWDGYYIPQAAIMTYDKNGTKKIVIPTTSYSVPSTALSVDLSGTNLSSVITTESNPNCLFILSSEDDIPEGLDGKNVITYNGNSYSAANISLTDGSDFYSPVDFTAENIEYTFDYEGKAGGTGKAADGTNGWSSIMLPYDVTKVTATSNENVTKEIDWFHSETDGGGQFWLKKFTDDSGGTVFFDYVEENGMKAYTPYIIALPGNRWGTSHQLNDKTIKFIGTNVTVYKGSTLSTITGSNYRFIGKTVTDGTENIYCLNADGNQFELNASGGSNPFRAYFKADTFDRTMTSLAIGSGSGTTDIQTFEPTSKPHTDSWYTLDGRRISGQPTQKGLYIVNGKKTVIK